MDKPDNSCDTDGQISRTTQQDKEAETTFLNLLSCNGSLSEEET